MTFFSKGKKKPIKPTFPIPAEDSFVSTRKKFCLVIVKCRMSELIEVYLKTYAASAKGSGKFSEVVNLTVLRY